jgi:hypothetical protein
MLCRHLPPPGPKDCALDDTEGIEARDWLVLHGQDEAPG